MDASKLEQAYLSACDDSCIHVNDTTALPHKLAYLPESAAAQSCVGATCPTGITAVNRSWGMAPVVTIEHRSDELFAWQFGFGLGTILAEPVLPRALPVKRQPTAIAAESGDVFRM